MVAILEQSTENPVVDAGKRKYVVTADDSDIRSALALLLITSCTALSGTVMVIIELETVSGETFAELEASVVTN